MTRYPLIGILFATTVLAGCASTPQGLDRIQDRASREAVSTVRSGATLIKEAEQLESQAKAQETYRFAPAMTDSAKEYLSEAKQARDKGKADNEVRELALTALATFEKAQDHTLVARETLAPSLAHLEVLNSIRSDTYYPSEYRAVNEDLDSIIRTLETTGAPASASQTQRQLLLDMHDLEVRTIGFIQLQQIRNRIAAMREAGAEKLIPRSFSTATTALASAEDLISKAPRADAEIAAQREAAKTAADHAQIILAMSNEVLDADKDNAEALVLRIERWLYNIAVALTYPDIRHLPMDEQSRQLAEEIEGVIQR
ncbi:MAG: hypothetical protein VX283_00320 [Pseudomonadota bacterium]|nr:hypothetical protein [Pseudomonadota bacterium]